MGTEGMDIVVLETSVRARYVPDKYEEDRGRHFEVVCRPVDELYCNHFRYDVVRCWDGGEDTDRQHEINKYCPKSGNCAVYFPNGFEDIKESRGFSKEKLRPLYEVRPTVHWNGERATMRWFFVLSYGCMWDEFPNIVNDLKEWLTFQLKERYGRTYRRWCHMEDSILDYPEDRETPWYIADEIYDLWWDDDLPEPWKIEQIL